MTTTTDSITEVLARLSEDYRLRLPQRIEEIEAQAVLLRATPDNSEALKTLHRQLHTLAGSSGTFGFSALGNAARALEMYLLPLRESRSAPNLTQLTQIDILLAAVRLAGATPAETGALPVAPAVQPADGDWVYLLDEDVDSAQPLSAQLGHFGYSVRVFRNVRKLVESLPLAPPSLSLIIDLALYDVSLSTALHNTGLATIPILFTSASDDVRARLRAVRAGGNAFFVKPLDSLQIVDDLDRLTGGHSPEPYRILLVDDAAEVAGYYALVLQHAGMVTHVETDPLRILESASDFRPDLVLIDLYMPEASGLEIATVLRQKDDFTSLPVVFLSVETDTIRQQSAMISGGDDFLVKPVEPKRLVDAVSQRSKRFRQLRSFMVRDGLTGLLNHAETIERLKHEMAHAARRRSPLAFCIIDLDHFKTINDSHGHLVGDQVIKSLTRQLRQCLRKTDLIGRFGGEEFAIVLPDTNVAVATQTVDQLRANFVKIGQHVGDKELIVTFSGGVAAYPPNEDPMKLIEAADRALYEAKRTGRNRICQEQS